MNESNALRVNMPTVDAVRAAAKRFLALWLGAMFLKTESYSYARDQKNPFGQALIYIAVLGVLIATAGILGAGLRYATLPNGDATKNAVLGHLQAMPFYESWNASLQDSFTQGYERTWDQLGSMFAGYPTTTAGFVTLLASLLTTPLGLVITWIVYGALVHLVARGWNRETSFTEMLGALALATSPQLLHVLGLFPTGGVSSGVVSLWALVCNIFAIRVAYQTTTRRAIWGAFFPILVVTVIVVLLVVVGLALLVPVSRTVGGAQ